MGVLRFSLIWWKNVCSAHWRIFMSGSCRSQQIHSVLHYTEKEKTETKKHSHIHPLHAKYSWNILKMWNESMNQWLVKLRYWSTPAVSQSSGKSLVASLVGKNKHPSTCCEWTNGVWRVDLEAFAASTTVSPEKGTEIWIGNASEPTSLDLMD